MKLSALNEFSLLIYKLLIKAFPQWTDLINNSEDDEETIILKVPSSQSEELALEVSTYDEEITVAYGNFHSHFGWSDVPDEKAFKEAEGMINEIISDKLLIAEYSKEGKVYQSETLRPEEIESYLELGPEVKVVGWSKSYLGR
jgi:hypothetical protein